MREITKKGRNGGQTQTQNYRLNPYLFIPESFELALANVIWSNNVLIRCTNKAYIVYTLPMTVFSFCGKNFFGLAIYSLKIAGRIWKDVHGNPKMNSKNYISKPVV